MKESNYKNSKLPVRDRVQDLINRMTLSEKVNQLGCELISEPTDVTEIKGGIGEVGINYDIVNISVDKIIEHIRKLQQQIINQSPHGIPAIFHCEAISGPLLPQSLNYPAPLSLAATFSPDIVRDMADRIRKQLFASGIRHAFSPVLDLARDFRWGRTNETYGSDPTLVAEMGCAYVEGLQGNDLTKGVAATAKHFLGHSQPEGGLNTCKNLIDKLDLRESFAKPFEAAIRKSGARCVMSAASSMDGIPIFASPRIITDLLRKDLGFEGLLVSDYYSINRMVDHFFVAEDKTEAAILCLKAGLDLETPSRWAFGSVLREAVKSGQIDEGYINRALERMLTLKFELGLFENPYPASDDSSADNADNELVCEEITKKVITLTKNEGILPLKDNSCKIAVIGPTGNNIRTMFGAYSYPAGVEMLLNLARNTPYIDANPLREEAWNALFNRAKWNGFFEEVCTVLENIYPQSKTVYSAIQEIFAEVTYTQGCDISNNEIFDFRAAASAAEAADIVIMTVGGINGWCKYCTSGENIDDSDISLPGRQHELIERVYKANKNIILVHTDNKPLVDEFAYNNIPAIIEAWLPGIYGAQAIADVITGKFNPGGRLPVDVPRSTGHMPAYHYQQNGCRMNHPTEISRIYCSYRDKPISLRLPFGFGLSYSTFIYSDFCIKEYKNDNIPIITFSIEIKNSGKISGDEVVQLYGTDKIASVIRPQQELLGFKRVTLLPNESKKAEFTVRLDQLAFINQEGDWVIEKGEFTFFIGRNSLDILFEQVYKLDETIKIDHRLRGFFAEVQVT